MRIDTAERALAPRMEPPGLGYTLWYPRCLPTTRKFHPILSHPISQRQHPTPIRGKMRLSARGAMESRTVSAGLSLYPPCRRIPVTPGCGSPAPALPHASRYAPRTGMADPARQGPQLSRNRLAGRRTLRRLMMNAARKLVPPFRHAPAGRGQTETVVVVVSTPLDETSVRQP